LNVLENIHELRQSFEVVELISGKFSRAEFDWNKIISDGRRRRFK